VIAFHCPTGRTPGVIPNSRARLRWRIDIHHLIPYD
jgi:hypothetical protein